jgi:hypothetical protein
MDSVAQPVEHMPFKHRVPGSNPGGITKIKPEYNREFFTGKGLPFPIAADGFQT